MYQREAARAAWIAAGLYKSRNAKLRSFLKAFDATPQDCWPQVVALVRSQYPELIAQLATPLWKSGDALLRVNLIRKADMSRADERALVTRLTSGLQPGRDAHALAALVEQGTPEQLDVVLRRKQLPDTLRLLANRRRAAFG